MGVKFQSGVLLAEVFIRYEVGGFHVTSGGYHEPVACIRGPYYELRPML